MASITGKTHLFFVTSPRSPYKMRNELKTLAENFSGRKWNSQLQTEFYEKLASESFFTGTLAGDIGFKARDRITRAPKALGLVDLSPQVQLTPAGNAYVYGSHPHEAFTRQLLKFQFPSPYHTDKGNTFFIKPYLELLRLIYELETLSKDEIAAFVIQLTHLEKYNEVKHKIEIFRQNGANLDRRKTSYNRYFDEIFTREAQLIYSEQIDSGSFHLRETRSTTKTGFIHTKKKNHKDYADAAIRYLRETKLVSLKSGRSNRIYIPDDKKKEVAFILETVPREPHLTQTVPEYKEYLFNRENPILQVDDREYLTGAILKLSMDTPIAKLRRLSLDDLKVAYEKLNYENLEAIITKQLAQLQKYINYDDIVDTYERIKTKRIFDAPLMMEWNTWRAFAMLDDGQILGNFRLDDTGTPLSTAAGNQADITCEYTDFDVLVEVTLSGGKRQYEMEGEPVARHVGDWQKQSDKDVYCIFIAQKLSPATLAHFYTLHQYGTAYYGGIVRIIPLGLEDFRLMLKQAYFAKNRPTASTIKAFVQQASNLANEAFDEEDWQNSIRLLVSSWV